jgi:hypothetical protein
MITLVEIPLMIPCLGSPAEWLTVVIRQKHRTVTFIWP